MLKLSLRKAEPTSNRQQSKKERKKRTCEPSSNSGRGRGCGLLEAVDDVAARLAGGAFTAGESGCGRFLPLLPVCEWLVWRKWGGKPEGQRQNETPKKIGQQGAVMTQRQILKRGFQ